MLRIIAMVLALAAACGATRAQTVEAEAPAGVDAAPLVAASPPPAPRLSLDRSALALGGALKAPGLWQAYKARFITEQGRVVDTGNNFISHSEGQGYGMLLAVAANDRATFDRLWGWTRANLMVRDDKLSAWRWEPNQRPGVSDMNNATDGDILIAWALAEAADYWKDPALRAAGRRIAVEVAHKTVLFGTKMGAILLPAVAGFQAADRTDGPVVNLSYYVFPAFSRLSLVAPEIDWGGLTQTGLDLLDGARAQSETLPPDWVSLKDGKVRPADGFPPRFSYDALRIPLYLAFAGVGEREQYAPFMALVKRTRGALAIVDVTNGATVGSFGDSGAGSIGALVACAFEGAKAPSELLSSHANENYYPATLHLLALTAVQMRYPSCLRK
jgi:endo-1,4-beta-D-glucanase Y